MTHVLIISHDVVGRHMAGTGIRYWEMAHVLAAQQPVTLIAPRPIDLEPRSPAITCGSYAWGDSAALAPWLRKADVVVANGLVLRAHPELAHADLPLVLDLYDPILLENLEAQRAAPAEQRDAQYAADHALLLQQLAAADLLLCATERQRDLYIGTLLAAGHLTPGYIDNDPHLERLITVAGFGLAAQPPTHQRNILRGVLPRIGADDLLLLWTGGLWDWLDPLTLVRAMPRVAECAPHARLVFLAGQHPGGALPMQMPEKTRQLAQELGLLNTIIFFYDAWLPYHERANALLEADIAVSLHRSHLETSYAAVRSRFLDHLWAGLPSIVSTGDAVADLVRARNLGYTVAPEDEEATADALCRLATDDTQRQQCAARARETAQHYTWEQTLAPLARFCRAPRRSPQRPRRAAPAPPPAQPERTEDGAMTNSTRDEMLSKLDQLWKVQPQPLTSGLPGFGRAKELANSLTRWYVQSIVDQQNAFHAAVVHTFQAFAAEMDQRHAELMQHIHHHAEAQMRRFERDELLIEQTREQLQVNVEHTNASVEAISFNRDLIYRTRHDIEQNLREQQQNILTTQQMADRLRERIEEDERRIERNKDLLEQLIQHIHDLDEAGTALAARLTAPSNGEPPQ
jgi:glycosyltransferase involved in cell wall biosynthesis